MIVSIAYKVAGASPFSTPRPDEHAYKVTKRL